MSKNIRILFITILCFLLSCLPNIKEDPQHENFHGEKLKRRVYIYLTEKQRNQEHVEVDCVRFTMLYHKIYLGYALENSMLNTFSAYYTDVELVQDLKKIKDNSNYLVIIPFIEKYEIDYYYDPHMVLNIKIKNSKDLLFSKSYKNEYYFSKIVRDAFYFMGGRPDTFDFRDKIRLSF